MNARRRDRMVPARHTRHPATLAYVVLVCLLAGCGSNAGLSSAPDPPDVATSTPQTSALVTPVPSSIDWPADGSMLTVTLRLMTYNVLWGGGVEREFDKNIAPSYHLDRLDAILSVVREVNPDLLAIEEAAGWERGQPSVAEQVAKRLGMSYFLAPDGTDLNVVLFSRFPIEDVQYAARLPVDFYSGYNGMLLKARVVLADDARLTVYVPHLNSQSSAVRACQVDALLRLSNTQPTGASVLLGDLNSRPTSRESNTMASAGWQFLGAESTWTVDKIWAGPGVAYRANRVLTTTATRALSDHLPAARWSMSGRPPSTTARSWPLPGCPRRRSAWATSPAPRTCRGRRRSRKTAPSSRRKTCRRCTAARA